MKNYRSALLLALIGMMPSCSKKQETGVPVGQYGSLTGAQASFGQSTDPKVVEFVKAYRAKYNNDPDAMVALGYDSLKLLADAMKRAGTTDPAKVTEAIAATKDFQGVTGKITLDAHRNPIKPAVMLEVKNGKFAYVETIAP